MLDVSRIRLRSWAAGPQEQEIRRTVRRPQGLLHEHQPWFLRPKAMLGIDGAD
jgi:hypothetical protein